MNKKLLEYDSQLHDTRIDFLKSGYSNIPKANKLLQNDPMVQVVRKLHPEYPARLDGPLWHVGRNWCHAKGPDCINCILRIVCPKIRN